MRIARLLPAFALLLMLSGCDSATADSADPRPADRSQGAAADPADAPDPIAGATQGALRELAAHVQSHAAGEPDPDPASDPQVSPVYSASAYDITPLPRNRVAELAQNLDEEQYRITQRAGTEPAFCGTLLDNKKDGFYACVVCDLPLFSSEHKFDSGTGWPSFFTPYDPDHIGEREDRAHGVVRTEIVCTRCDAHLGHVFPDGPPPTGLRYCLNSAAMSFYEKGEERPAGARPVRTQVAYFAGGCFWGIEHYFNRGPGVIEAISGYMQGDLDDPSYRQVVTGRTGHAEAVKVVYDPERISYDRLLEAFFTMHDPTQLNRQGPDIGTQYRSGIYYASDEQRQAAEAMIQRLSDAGRYSRPIVTELEQAGTFWRAEEYHQNYIERTGRPCAVPDPW